MSSSLLRLLRLLVLLLLLLPHRVTTQTCPKASPATPLPPYTLSLYIPPQQRTWPDGTTLTNPPIHHCAAILLSARWALAPPSCYDPDFSILALAAAATTFSGHQIAIEKWFHAQQSLSNKPAWLLLKLAADAPANASFARVNDNPNLPLPNSYVTALSYQVPDYLTTVQTQPEDQQQQQQQPLRQVDAVIVDTTKCPRQYPDDDEATVCKDRICAGWQASGAGCNLCTISDDHALLSFDADGEPVVLGMGADDGGRCEHAGLITLYNRAADFVGWMREQGAEFTTSNNAVPVFERPGEVLPSPEGVLGGAPPAGVSENAQMEDETDEQTEMEGEKSVPLGVAIGAPIGVVALIVLVVVVVKVVRK